MARAAKSATPLPAYRAQLATLVDRPRAGDNWIHEIKYDGYRIGCFVDAGRARLESRNGQDWTAAYPEVVAAAAKLPVRSALLDGEVAVLLPDGRTSFQALQNAGRSGRAAGQLVYFAFDLLHVDGRNLAALPLEQRKAELEALLTPAKEGGTLRYSGHFDAGGDTVLQHACKLGLEGIVSKRRDLPYQPGRNPSWQKSKCILRQEFVVGGFTLGEGSRAGIGSLLIGYHDDEGVLRFAGKVGNGPGFTAEYTTRLQREFERIEQKECPFRPRPPGWLGKHAHWVRPERVAEVSFVEWTEGGGVRHPLLQGFRTDKAAKDVRREVERPTGGNERDEQPSGPRAKIIAPAAPRKRPAASGETTVAGITITTPERSVYPALGLTKLDLARYYEAVAEWMLPYVSRRPLTLVRCEHGVSKPDALRSECSFLKHTEGWHRWAGPSLRRVQIQEQKKVGEYLVADTKEALVSLVQGDILEVHCWGSRDPDVERPDMIVLDLDPGPDVDWPAVIRAAKLTRKALESLGLESWPKLTGGKGVHVVVPFRPEHTWPAVYRFAHAFAGALAQQHPDVFTLDFNKGKRTGLVLLDYKRNHRAAVAVAAYSTRAHPGGAVSMPIGWSELKAAWPSDHFTVGNVGRRLDRLTEDPWRDVWKCEQRLSMLQP